MTVTEEERSILDGDTKNYNSSSPTANHDDEHVKPSHSSPCLPRRFLVIALCCLGMCIVNSMRVNLSISMVILLDNTSLHDNSNSSSITNMMKKKELSHVVLNWSPAMVGFLHSVFYIGFLITQIPGGYLCTRLIPGNRVLGGSIFLSCALNLLLPLAIAELGYVSTCIVRFSQGLAEGLSHPALYAIIRNWAPRSEKSTLAAICLAGVYAGPIIGFPMDGAVSHYWGWEYSYYIHGGLGIAWFILWLWLVYASPEVDPRISPEELTRIVNDREVALDHKHPIPWSSILLSPPVWAIIVCHFAVSWIFFLMLTNEPMYLDQFHFTILENGIFSSLPHVLKVTVTSISGYIADISLRAEVVSRTFIRKLYTVFGLGFEAACLYCLVLISEGHVAVSLLTLALGVSGLAVSGWQISHLDIAPDYASVLIGLSTTVGTLGGILSPIVVGLINKENTLANWQKSLFVTATVIAAGAVTYLIFGSAELQPWADQCQANPQECIQLREKEVRPADQKKPLASESAEKTTDSESELVQKR